MAYLDAYHILSDFCAKSSAVFEVTRTRGCTVTAWLVTNALTHETFLDSITEYLVMLPERTHHDIFLLTRSLVSFKYRDFPSFPPRPCYTATV